MLFDLITGQKKIAQQELVCKFAQSIRAAAIPRGSRSAAVLVLSPVLDLELARCNSINVNVRSREISANLNGMHWRRIQTSDFFHAPDLNNEIAMLNKLPFNHATFFLAFRRGAALVKENGIICSDIGSINVLNQRLLHGRNHLEWLLPRDLNVNTGNKINRLSGCEGRRRKNYQADGDE